MVSAYILILTEVGKAAQVAAAVAEVERATGLVFVDDGPTDEAPAQDRSVTSRWALRDDREPVLIAWATEDEWPSLAGTVVGEAGPVAESVRECAEVRDVGLEARHALWDRPAPGGPAVEHGHVEPLLDGFPDAGGADHAAPADEQHARSGHGCSLASGGTAPCRNPFDPAPTRRGGHGARLRSKWCPQPRTPRVD